MRTFPHFVSRLLIFRVLREIDFCAPTNCQKFQKYLQEQLGDVVFIELPDEGTEISKGDSTGAVESVKAASDIYAPISGTVTEKNTKLEEEAGLINKSPFEKGWLYKLNVKSTEELEKLLNEEQYEKFKKEEEASH
uniref:Glycine cleavage system H protein n=1 Tax=Caenorhabditis japonica TaxID=281687 RepID=A0A8R1DSA2_CAEJA